jgi:hypothetical protein
MPDRPVVTSYPHDRLSRLADIMTGALDGVPGTGDVRAVVMLNDRDGGCVYPHHYPDDETRRNALLFLDVVEHLVATGRALGVKVDVLIDGEAPGAS